MVWKLAYNVYSLLWSNWKMYENALIQIFQFVIFFLCFIPKKFSWLKRVCLLTWFQKPPECSTETSPKPRNDCRKSPKINCLDSWTWICFAVKNGYMFVSQKGLLMVVASVSTETFGPFGDNCQVMVACLMFLPPPPWHDTLKCWPQIAAGVVERHQQNPLNLQQLAQWVHFLSYHPEPNKISMFILVVPSGGPRRQNTWFNSAKIPQSTWTFCRFLFWNSTSGFGDLGDQKRFWFQTELSGSKLSTSLWWLLSVFPLPGASNNWGLINIQHRSINSKHGPLRWMLQRFWWTTKKARPWWKISESCQSGADEVLVFMEKKTSQGLDLSGFPHDRSTLATFKRLGRLGQCLPNQSGSWACKKKGTEHDWTT